MFLFRKKKKDSDASSSSANAERETKKEKAKKEASKSTKGQKTESPPAQPPPSQPPQSSSPSKPVSSGPVSTPSHVPNPSPRDDKRLSLPVEGGSPKKSMPPPVAPKRFVPLKNADLSSPSSPRSIDFSTSLAGSSDSMDIDGTQVRLRMNKEQRSDFMNRWTVDASGFGRQKSAPQPLTAEDLLDSILNPGVSSSRDNIAPHMESESERPEPLFEDEDDDDLHSVISDPHHLQPHHRGFGSSETLNSKDGSTAHPAPITSNRFKVQVAPPAKTLPRDFSLSKLKPSSPPLEVASPDKGSSNSLDKLSSPPQSWWELQKVSRLKDLANGNEHSDKSPPKTAEKPVSALKARAKTQFRNSIATSTLLDYDDQSSSTSPHTLKRNGFARNNNNPSSPPEPRGEESDDEHGNRNMFLNLRAKKVTSSSSLLAPESLNRVETNPEQRKPVHEVKEDDTLLRLKSKLKTVEPVSRPEPPRVELSEEGFALERRKMHPAPFLTPKPAVQNEPEFSLKKLQPPPQTPKPVVDTTNELEKQIAAKRREMFKNTEGYIAISCE